MKVYTAQEVADLLRVEYKTVLRLIKRNKLKPIPGIRHKRISETELNRFLSAEGGC